MKKQIMDEDIRPVSDFGANIGAFIQAVVKSKKPLILAKSGKNTLELLKDIRLAEQQIQRGEFLSDKEAKKRLLS